jgi:DNA-binding Lrp family transcriptional regulator
LAEAARAEAARAVAALEVAETAVGVPVEEEMEVAGLVEGDSAVVEQEEGVSEEEAVAGVDLEAVKLVEVGPEEGAWVEVAPEEAEKEEGLEEEEMAVVE